MITVMFKRMSSYCFHTPVSIKDCKPLTPGYVTRTPECLVTQKFVCRTLTDECEPYPTTFTASVVFQGDFLCVVLYIFPRTCRLGHVEYMAWHVYQFSLFRWLSLVSHISTTCMNAVSFSRSRLLSLVKGTKRRIRE